MAPETFFPTYKTQDNEMIYKEYSLCSQIYINQSKLIVNATYLIIIFIGGIVGLVAPIISQFLNKENVQTGKKLFVYLNGHAAFYVTLVFLLILSIVIIGFFTECQKNRVLSARKMIVLRRMLGISYGPLELILPSRRLEGTDNPFSIRLYEGLFSYSSAPFMLVNCIIPYFVYIFAHNVSEPFVIVWNQNTIFIRPVIFSGIFFLFNLYYFRRRLYDLNENMTLIIAVILSRLFRIKLVESIENALYRAKLAVFEMDRINVNVNEVVPILKFIEDKRLDKWYYFGVDVYALIRAGLSRCSLTRWLFDIPRKSGGSSLYQQVARTLFIVDLKPLLRRKIVEIFLAIWLWQKVSKEEIVKLYLASVRFENKVYGIHEALRYFWGEKETKKLMENIPKTVGFFLVERVGNIHSKMLLSRIQELLRQLLKENFIAVKDVNTIKRIYLKMVQEKKLHLDGELLDTFRSKWL